MTGRRRLLPTDLTPIRLGQKRKNEELEDVGLTSKSARLLPAEVEDDRQGKMIFKLLLLLKKILFSLKRSLNGSQRSIKRS